MKKSKNRVTPILVIILIILLWILAFCIFKKLKKDNNVKRLSLDDTYTTSDDIFLYSKGEYNKDNLPIDYIFAKATYFMSIEDIEIDEEKKTFKITSDYVDKYVKNAFGPDSKYDLTSINALVKTYFELNDHRLLFNVKYDANTHSYVGVYSEITDENQVLVSKKLLDSTDGDKVTLKIGYIFYKYDTNYKICNNDKCDSIVKEVDSLDNIEYDKYVTVTLTKASDDIYYFESSK